MFKCKISVHDLWRIWCRKCGKLNMITQNLKSDIFNMFLGTSKGDLKGARTLNLHHSGRCSAGCEVFDSRWSHSVGAIVWFDTKSSRCGNKVKTVVQVIWSQARIGWSVHPMRVSQNRKTIVLKVRVKSRLFLVGPALLAISVSRRAEGRGQDLRGRTFFTATCLR